MRNRWASCRLIPGHAAVTAFPRLTTLCDVEARLRLLDQFGDLQNVLSLANPPLELVAGPDVTPELARLANDALAEICAKHAIYFPAFIAALPMNNIDAALAEIDRQPMDEVLPASARVDLPAPKPSSFAARCPTSRVVIGSLPRPRLSQASRPDGAALTAISKISTIL
jgi:hypothetical protein